MERAGLLLKVPDWWKGGQASRPQVNIQLDVPSKSRVGLDALLRFQVLLTLQNETLSPEEIDRILEAEGNLISLKGQWVEVDAIKLRQALAQWRRAELAQTQAGIPFHTGMRLLAGLPALGQGTSPLSSLSQEHREWTQFSSTGELADRLSLLRSPHDAHPAPPTSFRAS
ncbi:MAG: SNF2 helicase-associated domain-containing protein, partial [Planctomycetota bacterium]